MSFLSYLFPQTKCITSSKYNSYIRINEEQGQMKLLLNGSPQSGAYIEKLWRHAFRAFDIPKAYCPKTALVLGIGGGTVMRMLTSFYQDIHITGVDIDPTIVALSKKYFQIETIPHTDYVVSDAVVFIKKAQEQKKKYDMIIVDIFIGNHIPEFVFEDEFLKHIHGILSPKGVLLINSLREREYKEQSEILKEKLLGLFSEVKESSIAFNRFFLAQ